MKTTFHSATIKGTPISVPNVATQEKDYYVSYNNYDISLYGSDTTAIVIEKSGAFLILNGDHREALKNMSLEQACNYFHSNPTLKNSKSDHHQNDKLIEVNGKLKIVKHKLL
jgi:hypothetical protein